jgi:hypothetical protein
MLVPTTLLVEQHFQTFTDRFANLPAGLAELSPSDRQGGEGGAGRSRRRPHRSSSARTA